MADEITQAIMQVAKEWGGETLPEANAQKVNLGIHHNRVETPIPSRMKFSSKDGQVTISLKLSKHEVFTAKGIGRNPQNRIRKPWMDPIFDKVEDLNSRAVIAVNEQMTKFLKW